MASVGHVRDLPGSAKEVPDDKKETHGRLAGIDADDHFDVVYVVHPSKKKVVADLKRAMKDADELILATDEDREGEAIGWHVREVLDPRIPVKRMVFHEITPHAIREALDQPRDLDMKLVEAQEARRILDRLVGWETSPILWRVFGREQAASAGRVQSVAVRLVVERERARMAFRAGRWHDLEGHVPHGQRSRSRWRSAVVRCRARRARRAPHRRRARLRPEHGPFAARSRRRPARRSRGRGARRSPARRPLPSQQCRLGPVQRTADARRSPRPRCSRKPAASFGSWRRARWRWPNGSTSGATSPTCAPTARTCRSRRSLRREPRSGVSTGTTSCPTEARTYRGKVKNAQEAHEAIRPAGDEIRTPDAVRGELDGDEQRLYELIWMKTIACQMVDARGRKVTIRLAATSTAGEAATFRAAGKTYDFLGWRRGVHRGCRRGRRGRA